MSNDIKVVYPVDLSKFSDKHILFTQSHDRSGADTEHFAMVNVPDVEYEWYKWDNSPEEPPMYVPSILVQEAPKTLEHMIQLYSQHYIEGGYDGEIIGEADDYGDVSIDLDTEECVFLCLGGDSPMEDDE